MTLLLGFATPAFSEDAIRVGVATIEITPDEPIRMSGYGGRKVLSEGIASPLFAKALVFGENEEMSALVTADLVGIPDWLKVEVARRLDLPEHRLAICATHTHSGPQLKDLLIPIFMEPIPEDHLATVDRYASFLVDQMEAVCREAMSKRRNATLDWGVGSVAFASNRRVLENGIWTGFGVQADGPVDHSLPVMRIRSEQGRLLALLANYACHCTTLGGDFHQLHGDWAGEAQRLLEQRHPGATALISIGCGADANPNPRGSMEAALQNGQALADEVDKVLSQPLKPIRALPITRLNRIQLPLDPIPERDYWEQLAASEEKTAYYGQVILDRMDRGVRLPTSIDYPIQTWTFGDDLAMIFLAGEVVVDYSIKLKELFDEERLWINAYANATPSYLASRRLYDEGGYEVDRSMYYYDKPTRLAPETEELVLDEAFRQMPFPFYSGSTLRRVPAPISKEDALTTIITHPEVTAQLAASEPMVMDPIDMAWDLDGRMWVVEMADYPLGIDGQGKKGGRIRILDDENGDGIYDSSVLFLDDLSFPTSVFPWRDGALIVATPDIVFARDLDADGRADTVETLFTGLTLGNQQHLANGMQWGLDGWIYLANGDSGGVLGSTKSEVSLDVNGRDFRIHPELGLAEAVIGRSQYGRNRDSWGNWFGNSNSWPGWHYALEDRYLSRNPYAAYPSAKAYLPPVPQAGTVYPESATLSRYNDYEKANRFTSACGFMIYEDEGLGDAFVGNSFVSEPVHNLVSRGIVYRDGTSFRSRRAPEEERAEFLASTDNWFRPTAIRNGPDGALYIADMYRLVIEHPQWIPQDWQRKLELREGHDKGRIYRVSKKGGAMRKVPRLSELSIEELVVALDSPIRWQRDQVHQRLLWLNSNQAVEPLRRIAKKGRHPEARGHALWVLNQLEALDSRDLVAGLKDPSPGVRRQAVRLSESHFDDDPIILNQVIKRAKDSDLQVRLQVAYALGETADPKAGRALAGIVSRRKDDPYLLAAVLSSALPHQTMLAESLAGKIEESEGEILFRGLLQTAVGTGNDASLSVWVNAIGAPGGAAEAQKSLKRFAIFLDVLRQSGTTLIDLEERSSPSLRNALTVVDSLFSAARDVALDSQAPIGSRAEALALVASDPSAKDAYLTDVERLLNPKSPTPLQLAAVRALHRILGSGVVSVVLEKWKKMGPTARREIIDTLLNDNGATIALLGAAEREPEIASMFSAVQVAELNRHRIERIRELSQRVFGERASSARSQVIASFRSALEMEGDPIAGQSHFADRCAACHKIGDMGYAVGPDLTSLTDKSPQSMLVAILDPNRAVEDKFTQYFAQTTGGPMLSGVVSEETATSLTFVTTGGIQTNVLRRNLESLESAGRSLMPEGLEAGMEPQAMADLIAFISGSTEDLKIRAEADGSIGLAADRGIASGPTAYFNGETGAFERVSSEDRLQWTVYDLKAGHYDVFTDASLSAEYEGRPFVLEVNDTFITGTISTTGGLDRYRKRKFGNIEFQQDVPVATFTLRHSLEGSPLSIKELRMIPVP